MGCETKFFVFKSLIDGGIHTFELYFESKKRWYGKTASVLLEWKNYFFMLICFKNMAMPGILTGSIEELYVCCAILSVQIFIDAFFIVVFYPSY